MATIESIVLESGRAIPFGEDPNADEHAWVRKVRWTDGRESYAKSWAEWDGERWRHVRIGLGANGDWDCWTPGGWIERQL